jgi:hypothetical protein
MPDPHVNRRASRQSRTLDLVFILLTATNPAITEQPAALHRDSKKYSRSQSTK